MVKRIYNLKIEKLPPKQLNIMKLAPATVKLPTNIDLRNKMPVIYDQGEIGSCTANALCGLIGYDKPGFCGSRLFVYYNERLLEKSIPYDVGSTLSDGIKTFQIYGVCPESIWPYIPFRFATKPTANCYQDALKEKALRIQNILCDLISMKKCLISGFPFVIGICVYDSFETDEVANTGMVPMPESSETLLGGHAVLCCGYDDEKQCWIMRNSWGVNWGIKGYFYLPYAYLTNPSLASDAWTITLMQ
jgi:C1A family cysteine protease